MRLNFINYTNEEVINQWLVNERSTSIVEKLWFAHELLPLALCIFLVGFIGFWESREFLSLLINIEIMMLGMNFYLITTSLGFGDYVGQVYALCFLAVTAAETAVGLGLLILLYRAKGRITFTELSTLKG
jgi:NADH-quinone oxidoreductase subunit K